MPRLPARPVYWVYSPGGLLSYKSYLDAGTQLRLGPLHSSKSLAGQPEDDVHPLDVYTRPEVVEELGTFIHRVLTALGCAFNDQLADPRELEDMRACLGRTGLARPCL